MLGNPVQDSRIQSLSEYQQGKWDGSGYIVTAGFGQIDADHPTPHQGIDLGNGRCGGRVLAMATGTVSLILQGPGAWIVRVRHEGLDRYFQGREVESGAAHLSKITVVKNQRVQKGQIIGLVGHTGASVCHLHQGLTVGGVEVNWWPYLDQNKPQEDQSMTIARIYPYPKPKTWTAAGGKVVGYTLDGKTKTVTLNAGSQAQAVSTANISQSPKKAPNGHGFIEIGNGALAGYFVLPTAGTVA